MSNSRIVCNHSLGPPIKVCHSFDAQPAKCCCKLQHLTSSAPNSRLLLLVMAVIIQTATSVAVNSAAVLDSHASLLLALC